MRKLSRPPSDLSSFIGRKWLEELVRELDNFDAISDLTFLVLQVSSRTPNARRLVGGADIEISDGGAGADAALTLTDTAVVAGSYSNSTVTVDSKGRVTSAASGVNLSDLAFVTIGHPTGLTGERELSGSSNIEVTDGGANGAVTLDLSDAATPGVFTKVTVDSKGRVTLGASVSFSDISGILGETQGGTGQSGYAVGDILYCSSVDVLSSLGIGSENDVLTVVSGVPSWQSPTSGSGNAVEVTVDFGSGADFATATITGETWVGLTSKIICGAGGVTSDHPDEEDAVLEGLRYTVANLVAGDGFDVFVHAPETTWGQYKVNCIGV